MKLSSAVFDGSSFYHRNIITQSVDGTVSSGGKIPTRTMFWTTDTSGSYNYRMVIDNMGRVGINTYFPNYYLDVEGTASVNWLNINEAYTFPVTDGTSGQFLKTNGSGAVTWGNVNWNRSLPDTLGFHLMTTGLVTDGNWISGDGDPEGIQVDFSGNVGIGTNTPGARLHVQSTTGVATHLTAGSSDVAALNFGTTSNNSMGSVRYSNAANSLEFWTNNTSNRMLINASGNVGIGQSNPTFKLDVLGSSGTRMRIQDSGTGFAGMVAKNTNREFFIGVQGPADFASGEFHIFDNTGAARRMVIDAAGFMGINTSDPTSRLEVNGDVEVGTADAFYFGDPNTDGSWRIKRSGNNLVFERRESGTWVTKTSMIP